MFRTHAGLAVPSVDEEQMRRVDQIAVDQYGYSILQMMENAGRNLALTAVEMIPENSGKVIILAGSGGNGGGGLCAARHLLNRGFQVEVYLTKPVDQLTGAARSQIDTLLSMGIHPLEIEEIVLSMASASLVLDALIGYGLSGPPNEQLADLITAANQSGVPILSLDIPSGMHATTGETPGACVAPRQTLTLALPKNGLIKPAAGELVLGDIGIPHQVFEDIGISLPDLFKHSYRIPLERTL